MPRSTPALHDALADERNRDLGTFWAVQLRRHGVSMTDPAAVEVFLRRVASRVRGAGPAR